ncbi:N-acetylmuramoyl-L-alanine amidase [Actinomadura rudentiformis]|uniref:N-acetylmuramoyl-L-alanine amidase n=2 Tax=Actinomadura rudentiformis TaxID=359158 RepID=A0A6H9YX98_9ACTN|nr:N-acetylmuramoyl-L-alanine amidase [Actinomadura rudentiformis]
MGLVLCLAALTACDGGSSTKDGQAGGQTAQPPMAAPSGASTAPKEVRGTGSLKGKVIVIDPGHNGGNAKHPEIINRQVSIGNGRKACDTTGTATAAGYSEAAFTWDVSTRLSKLLRAKGAKVVLTRNNNTGVGPCITERAAIGNRAKADAAISVHADGGPASGHGFHVIEPLTVKGHNASMVPASRKLGKALRDAYRKDTGMPYSTYIGTDALDSRDDLGGLNLSTVPKVFVETGNMRNPGDAAKLSSASFRQRIAESFVTGLIEYFR